MRYTSGFFALLPGLLSLTAFGQTFTNLHNGFPTLQNASVAWGDYDHDGLPDLARIGFSGTTAEVSTIYHNDGDGVFTLVYTLSVQVSDGAVSWGDYDHDGDLDLLVNGQNGSAGPPAVTTLVRNDGGGLFTELTGVIPGVIGVARWIDYDGDGWLDVVTCGLGVSLAGDSTRLFHNDTTGTFTEVPSHLPGFAASDISVVDFDMDNDMDFFLTGGTLSVSTFPVTKLYRNDGAGNYTEVPSPFKNLSTGTSKWADYDHDGDPDLLYDGIDSTFVTGHTMLYRNDGAGNFTLINANLPGSGEPGSVDWADIDNDGDLDILLGGPTTLLRNDANNSFVDITPADFPPSVPNSFADIDNDGDQDILFGSSSAIFRNDLITDIIEMHGNDDLRISPNPAHNVIMLGYTHCNAGRIEIYDFSGQLLNRMYTEIAAIGPEATIDISQIAPGIYFLKMGNAVSLFVKE